VVILNVCCCTTYDDVGYVTCYMCSWWCYLFGYDKWVHVPLVNTLYRCDKWCYPRGLSTWMMRRYRLDGNKPTFTIQAVWLRRFPADWENCLWDLHWHSGQMQPVRCKSKVNQLLYSSSKSSSLDIKEQKIASFSSWNFVR
jgi:hypothetical protein